MTDVQTSFSLLTNLLVANVMTSQHVTALWNPSRILMISISKFPPSFAKKYNCAQVNIKANVATIAKIRFLNVFLKIISIDVAIPMKRAKSVPAPNANGHKKYVDESAPKRFSNTPKYWWDEMSTKHVFGSIAIVHDVMIT